MPALVAKATFAHIGARGRFGAARIEHLVERRRARTWTRSLSLASVTPISNCVANSGLSFSRRDDRHQNWRWPQRSPSPFESALDLARTPPRTARERVRHRLPQCHLCAWMPT